MAPTPDQPRSYVLDARSFNSAERLEVQREFGQHYGDLLMVITDAINPKREGMMTRRVIDPGGVQRFPDEIVQYMLWVQEKRGRPDADLAEFDDLTLVDLNQAHIDGLLGKAPRPPKSKKSSAGPDSSDSSTVA